MKAPEITAPEITAAEAIRRAAAAIGGPTARLDAELLVADAAGCAREQLLLHPQRAVGGAAVAARIARRRAGEPVAYIVGRQAFWSHDLRVTADVLIPRPDTETLIEAALDLFPKHAPLRILDLGTGSGALALAALSEWPAATALAADLSEAALAVARANAERLGLDARCAFVRADWADDVDGRFDLMLCNPPYVARGEALGPGVQEYEPHGALFAGADGLDAYRRIVPAIPGLLSAGGRAILEIGHRQAAALLRLGAAAGLAGTVRQDLERRDRAIIFHLS